jgi:hypothetical protein
MFVVPYSSTHFLGDLAEKGIFIPSYLLQGPVAPYASIVASYRTNELAVICDPGHRMSRVTPLRL